MKIFESVSALAEEIGLPLETDRWDQTAPGGFPTEADWGYRLHGCGLPGGPAAGWLLTRAAQDESKTSQGHLIAYTIVDGTKTGRCALLRSPWSYDLDNRELDRLRQQSWWNAAGHHVTGGEADLSDVDHFLRGMPR